MMKKSLIVFFVFCALLVSIRPAAAKVSLLVLGDSLSAGYGMAEADSWVREIDRYWQENYPEFDIINASISGETTQGGLNRLPQLIERHHPDWVFIELGGNDGLRGFNLNTMANNIREMIRMLQQAGIKVALSEVEITPNLGRRYTEMFRQTFHDIAEEKDIPLIPFFMREIALVPEYMQSDGIHPSLEAQPRIAEIMEPQLRKLMESNR